MKLKIFEWEIDLSEPRFGLRRARMGFHDAISFTIPKGTFPMAAEDRHFSLLVPHEDKEEAKKLIRMAIKNAYAGEYNRRKNEEKLKKVLEKVGKFEVADIGARFAVKPSIGYGAVVFEFGCEVSDWEKDIDYEVVKEVTLTREQALELAKYLKKVVEVLEGDGDADD